MQHRKIQSLRASSGHVGHCVWVWTKSIKGVWGVVHTRFQVGRTDGHMDVRRSANLNAPPTIKWYLFYESQTSFQFMIYKFHWVIVIHSMLNMLEICIHIFAKGINRDVCTCFILWQHIRNSCKCSLIHSVIKQIYVWDM